MMAQTRELPAADEEFDGRVDDVIDQVRTVVWSSARIWGVTDKALSAATRLSANTISRFGSGETKSPHLRTAARLAMALDLDICLRRRSTGEIVSLGEFGDVKPINLTRQRR